MIRFGATPTSKPVLTMLTDAEPIQIVVDGDGGWSDPAILPTTFIHADGVTAACALADSLEGARAGGRAASGAWASRWLDADRAADSALATWLAAVEARDEPFEGLPFAALGTSLPDGALLWAGNSMPVRDLDDWLPGSERAIRPLSNRGANGIDGVVSTALGAAAADVGPVVLVVGDVSFLHDLNALVSARLHGLSATIVLVDNDGGGIFSFLPQATTDAPEVGLPEHYEELFGTPHGIDVGPIVTALGGEYREVGPASIRAALAASIGRPGVRVLAFRTDRARNVELHREAAAAVAEALRTAMSGIVVDGLRWEVRSRGAGSPLLLIHGFTGRGTSWGRHATAFARHRRVISVDLPGHGRSGIPSDPGRASVERTADDLAVILGRVRAAPADVIGYSLGARVALRLAIVHPGAIRRLVLESPSAGLPTEPERRARRAADAALADRLERDGIEAFVDEWERQPVFASQRHLPACDRRSTAYRSACAIGRLASPRACVGPARASWRRSTTASRRSERRPSSSPAPSTRPAAPGPMSSRPRSLMRASSCSPAPATPRTSRRPPPSDRSPRIP